MTGPVVAIAWSIFSFSVNPPLARIACLDPGPHGDEERLELDLLRFRKIEPHDRLVRPSDLPENRLDRVSELFFRVGRPGG